MKFPINFFEKNIVGWQLAWHQPMMDYLHCFFLCNYFNCPLSCQQSFPDDFNVTPNYGNNASDEQQQRPFQLLSFDWSGVEVPYIIAAWLMLASVAKILFHAYKRVAETVPDSALLIVLGFGLGQVLRLCRVERQIYMFEPSTFFLYLLPPIIFEAGFYMPTKLLLENYDSILLFAFVGTIWNTVAVALSFAACISSVDPVAVIGIFEQINLNKFLFINVFGEALFNDAASVTLYQMFIKFSLIGTKNLNIVHYCVGIMSFAIIAIGGVIIGLFFAVLSCIATKYTTQFRIFAPVFVFVLPYMSYLTAQMFGTSAILSLIACSISMKKVVKANLCSDSYMAIKYFVKLLAQSSEAVIFLFLGLSLVPQTQNWDFKFVSCTIAFCLLYRAIGVIVQCALLNRFRSKKFSFADQFVLSYSGLRGAISFGLVISLQQFQARQMFITTTLAVIFFTVFVQGISIRPLLFWLKVEREETSSTKEEKKDENSEEKLDRYTDYAMVGLETMMSGAGKHFLKKAGGAYKCNRVAEEKVKRANRY
uniref:Sodium/hydrogen exchanger n=1 Tax=Globodera rostochiensis TaxID=31243 RepID=A0A914IEH4_GLORO